MEVWKNVPGFEFYQISSEGRVWSLPRTIARTGDRGNTACLKGKYLKIHKTHAGYLYTVLSKDGKRKAVPIHRLVLLAFIGPCPEGMQARHFPDNSKTNNRPENLSWATPKQNSADREFHGTLSKGEKHSRITKKFALRGTQLARSRFNDDQIREMRKLREQGWTLRRIAKKFDYDHANVLRIVRREMWAHVK